MKGETGGTEMRQRSVARLKPGMSLQLCDMCVLCVVYVLGHQRMPLLSYLNGQYSKTANQIASKVDNTS